MVLFYGRRVLAEVLAVTAILLISSIAAFPAPSEPKWSEQEKPIVESIKHLRDVPDDKRPQVTRDLAQQIRQLPANDNRVELATALASLSTEGDFGKDTLQAVANTLAETLRQHPAAEEKGQPAYPYLALAELARYEHVDVSLDAPQYKEAMAKLEADDQRRANADFTLTDLQGHAWTLKSLHGKVVLVNFWATWCPPCRKELPDLEKLSQKFKDQGLLVLAISDEKRAQVTAFIEKQQINYPILLDNGGEVAKQFGVDGIPKTFVYDREGKLVAQAIDMRTQQQFLAMLEKAGLK